MTGSSSGVGEGIAHALAADGFTVVVNSATSVDAGERLAARLPGASYVQADIADPSDAVRLVETTVERHGLARPAGEQRRSVSTRPPTPTWMRSPLTTGTGSSASTSSGRGRSPSPP
ncbi:SDR family NAD(P)-dependent oxidoreductase [Nonomuraea ferruginea]